MKTTLIIIGAILILAIALNPDKDTHNEAVKNLVYKNIEAEKVSPDNGLEMMGQLLAMKFIDTMLDEFIQRDNYLLFSLTKIRYMNESRIIGIGAFNYVYVDPNVSDALKDAENETFDKLY